MSASSVLFGRLTLDAIPLHEPIIMGAVASSNATGSRTTVRRLRMNISGLLS